MHERTRSVIAAVLGALGLAAGSCFSLSESSLATVGAQFSQLVQCPMERVSAGLDATATKPPPADVAADPARLAMYNQQVATDLATNRWVEVRGCGHIAEYQCHHWVPLHGGDQVACTLSDHDPYGLSMVMATRTIDAVAPGGLGERIGFRAGDVVVALDHQPVTDGGAYRKAINDPASPGHVVTVKRGAEQMNLTVPRAGN
jgi:membrane-associated protease RseP (regulator of RpoE activity)